MQIDLAIRTAGKADLPSLLELYRQLNPGDRILSVKEAERSLRQLVLYPGSAIIIGVRDDVIVTTCTLVVVPNLTRAGLPYALIENVVTDNAHRKRGYGRLLLNHALSAAWSHDCYKVMLLTGSKDPATLRFYATTGFEQTKTGFQIRRIEPRQS
ncbi:N-acetyltransferase family protein [Hoeflea sp. TYP-13]|uniref:N-acetyltransferase family protein n=1 Tax=Hoeflea sp. TYP-13 TaxID=3230023 RepID=UPI0034C63D27